MKGKTLQPLQKTHGGPVPLLYGVIWGWRFR
jgi:hypothetical protein